MRPRVDDVGEDGVAEGSDVGEDGVGKGSTGDEDGVVCTRRRRRQAVVV